MTSYITSFSYLGQPQNLNPKEYYQSLAREEFQSYYGNVFDNNGRAINGFAGKWDAFAHIYTSALLTDTHGSTVAHLFGDINELRLNNY